MSSLLIKGMDIPKDCAGCSFSYYDDGYNGGYGWNPSGYRCRRLKRLIEEDENKRNYYPKPSDCPLSEMPTTHGRLIDEDSLIEYINKELKGDEYIQRMFRRIVKSRPTVIEAER